MNVSDAKAATSSAWDENASATVYDLAEQRLDGGVSVWKLGTAIAITESLPLDAPEAYTLILRQRALCNLTGRCPQCEAVAGVNGPGRGQITHATRCTVAHPPRRLLDLLDPAATAAITAMKGTRS